MAKKAKWKPRREFKVIDDKRAIKKAAQSLADGIAPDKFAQDLEQIDADAPDAFASLGKIVKTLGGTEKRMHDSHILMMEWAIKYPEMTPHSFLVHKRGYSEAQTDIILRESGGAKYWDTQKIKILDKMSESVVKRHIDKMVEMNDQHIAISKLSLAKAFEMLTHLPVKAEEGKKSMRAIDLVNITTAAEKAQAIYRKAMGMPNEESGMAQILEKVASLTAIQTTNIQNNNTVVVVEKTELQKKIEQLDYDQIMEFIEHRREKKALAAKKQEDESNR